MILRLALFRIVPTILEIFMVMAVLFYMYSWDFCAETLFFVVSYLGVTVLITECRAKSFKRMAQKDTEYVQKATDSLLNFETVKYFNAEDHEERRFTESLKSYKAESIKV